MKTTPKAAENPLLVFAVCAVFFFAVLIAAVWETPDMTPLLVGTATRTTVTTVSTTPQKVPLNTAAAEELEMLPGIGPVLAERIVRYRQEHGPFQSVDDLLQVEGIGEKTVEKLRDRVVL